MHGDLVAQGEGAVLRVRAEGRDIEVRVEGDPHPHARPPLRPAARALAARGLRVSVVDARGRRLVRLGRGVVGGVRPTLQGVMAALRARRARRV